MSKKGEIDINGIKIKKRIIKRDKPCECENFMSDLEKEKRISEEDVEKNKIVNHRGLKVIKRERDVLIELENELGEVIPSVSSIDWETFGFIIRGGHIVGLGLYGRGLTSLPDSIGQLTSLTELNLGYNHLTTLPDSIGLLKSIAEISLKNNHLTTLPDTFGQLASLTNLYLFNNHYISPGHFDKSNRSTNTLILWNNKLTSLPATFGDNSHPFKLKSR